MAGMTREEFMAHAKSEIELALGGTKNRLMNLVQQAWAEGKRNSETELITGILREAVEKLTEKPKTGSWEAVDPDVRGYTNKFRCTNCGRNIRLAEYTKACSYDYCPECDAKMSDVLRKAAKWDATD